MTNDRLINLKTLDILSRDDKVTPKKVIIMLGSNDDADKNLSHAIECLGEFGDCILSECIVSADYTGLSSDYSNQAVLFTPYKPTELQTLIRQLKNMERNAGRVLGNTKKIPLDLDVLLCYQDEWHIIKERHPFKSHEINVLATMGVIAH